MSVPNLAAGVVFLTVSLVSVLALGDEAVNCPVGKIQCDGRCLQEKFVCDGHPDCPVSGKDEQGCYNKCKDGSFYCDDRCHPAYERCDDTQDCADGTDEQDCIDSEQRDLIICGRGPLSVRRQSLARCDGWKNCPGGQDEFNCPPSCGSLQGPIFCGGRCLRESAKCDGVVDCPDSGLDEIGCPIVTPAATTVTAVPKSDATNADVSVDAATEPTTTPATNTTSHSQSQDMAATALTTWGIVGMVVIPVLIVAVVLVIVCRRSTFTQRCASYVVGPEAVFKRRQYTDGNQSDDECSL